MTRDGKRTADIGIERTVRQRRIAKPAGKKPGHETVASTKNVEHLDFPHRRGDAVIPLADVTVNNDAAKRAPLAY